MRGGLDVAARTRPLGDYRALTGPVTRPELRAFRKSLAGTPYAKGAAAATGSSIVTIIVVPILALLFVVVIGFAEVGLLGSGPNGEAAEPLILLLFVVVVVAAIAVVYRIFKKDVAFGRPLRRWFRLDRYARESGWLYLPTLPAPAYAGCVFTNGTNRLATDVIGIHGRRWVEVGNYAYREQRITGQGGMRKWGYIRLTLDRPLPHMLLESTAHKKPFRTKLPATYKRGQVLSLEGDFDKYFTLYAPKNYERDALYVFTPDLMVLLMDNAADFDVEIIDMEMFVYSSKPFDMLAPATFARVGHLVQTVGSKTWSQTTNYGDDRAGQFAGYTVAPQGRRLRRAVPIFGIIVITLYAVLRFAGPIIQIIQSQH